MEGTDSTFLAPRYVVLPFRNGVRKSSIIAPLRTPLPKWAAHIPWGLSQITSEQFLYHYCLTRLTSFREQSQTKLMQDCSLVSDYLPALSYSSTFLVAIMPEEQMAVECFEEFQKNSETI